MKLAKTNGAMVALIDGDIIAYQACTAGQKTYDWGDTGGKATETVSVQDAIDSALRKTHQWIKSAQCRDGIVAFTSGINFRKDILPTYKAGRKDKPEGHAAVVEAMKVAFPFHEISGLEADDVLGILATTDRFIDRAVVVTLDKDLKTVPGLHCNPAKEALVTVDVAHADYAWLWQTLCGDTTDNYTGLPKCGPVGAAKILGSPTKPDGVGKLWTRVLAAYRAKGYTEEFALIQARVARILRRSDYDKETKEVLLWHPTTPIRLPLTIS